jgi:hypothetical protein
MVGDRKQPVGFRPGPAGSGTAGFRPSRLLGSCRHVQDDGHSWKSRALKMNNSASPTGIIRGFMTGDSPAQAR